VTESMAVRRSDVLAVAGSVKRNQRPDEIYIAGYRRTLGETHRFLPSPQSFSANPPFHGYLSKGTVVFVEGRLQPQQFEDREGGTKTVTEVVVASLRVLGGARNSSHSDNDQAAAVSNADDAKSETVPF